ncbi:transcriptional regulator [Mesorhizobium sp. Root157]|uniref:helix-turn-helix domain-containing protein n=1 Tax=Mesorhizobium sp. Root157 TaxID=1736477 RepID=UPI0006F9F159|nr:helix-turn-helix domain-containing protein [Mesorhizobium sp. Root157]KQZ87277.1 transcriptional regulator [Mesorhizobium sp. Root157]
MTKPKAWDRHEILACLRRKHMTLAGIAETYGLALSGVKNIWTRPNERVERAIADFIGEPVETVFQDRYPKRRNRILATKFTTPSKPAPARRDAA